MPAPIAPLVGFALGVMFAWIAADELVRAAGSGVSSRSLIVVMIFSLLVFAPVSAYFIAFYPDWAYAYLVDSQRLPTAVDLGLVLLDAASVPLGFAVAARRASLHRVGAVLRIAAAPGLAAVLFVGVLFRRLAVHATYAQFHGDFGTHPVSGSSVGYSLLWMAAVLAAGIVWTSRSLRRIGLGARRD